MLGTFVHNTLACIQVGHQSDQVRNSLTNKNACFCNIRNNLGGKCVGCYIFLRYLATSNMEGRGGDTTLQYFECNCSFSFGKILHTAPQCTMYFANKLNKLR